MAKKPKGMHAEDIKGWFAKRGISLTALALAHDLPDSACRVALRKPYYEAELVIAEGMNKHPYEIWPDRFNNKDLPFSRPRILQKVISGQLKSHCQKSEAA